MNRQQSRPSSTPQCEVIFATLQQKKEKKREAHTKNFCEKKKCQSHQSLRRKISGIVIFRQ
jgi:hypothetical protein